MSYWRGDAGQPARIAQFTSSGFKNVMPVYLRALDRSAMLLQELLRARIGVERFGWDRPAEDLVLLPDGPHRGRPRRGHPGQAAAQPGAAAGARLAGRQRARRAEPAGADAPGSTPPSRRTGAGRWPRCSTTGRTPNGRPRSGPGRSTTRRSRRSWPTRDQVFSALQTIAARHQSALDRMRNARQMMFRSNFGICRFTTEPAARSPPSTRCTPRRRPRDATPVLEPYMVQTGTARSGRSRRRPSSCGVGRDRAGSRSRRRPAMSGSRSSSGWPGWVVDFVAIRRRPARHARSPGRGARRPGRQAGRGRRHARRCRRGAAQPPSRQYRDQVDPDAQADVEAVGNIAIC